VQCLNSTHCFGNYSCYNNSCTPAIP
jgi:hypothetical protein